MQLERLAHERKRRGLTLSPDALVRAFERVLPGGPAKLSRGPAIITYVGGAALAGAQRAVGIWPDGAEPSNVMMVADDAEAERVAIENGQHSAIWFRPGAGEDSLHIFTIRGTPAEAARTLAKHGVSYATLVPSGDSVTVHVVDQGSQFAGVLPGKTVRGRATYKELDPVPAKLSRTLPRTDPTLRAMISGWQPEDHVGPAVAADYLEEQEDWRHRLLRHVMTRKDAVVKRGSDLNWIVKASVVQHVHPYDAGHASLVGRGPDGNVHIATHWRADKGHTHATYSRHTPEEYEALRADAASAGTHFPEFSALKA